MKCAYGCNQKANYTTSNGKQCCSKHYNSCPKIKEKNSKGLKKAHKENPNMNKHAIKGKMVGWDKFDVDKESDIRASSGKKLKQLYADGTLEPTMKGKTHTLESRKKMSNHASKINNGGKCKFFMYKGIKLQGTWELNIAKLFDKFEIQWDKLTVKKSFKYFKDYERSYIPDFYLEDLDLYIEVKGVWYEETKEKMRLVEKYNIEKIKKLSVIDKEDYTLLKDINYKDFVKLLILNTTKRPWNY